MYILIIMATSSTKHDKSKYIIKDNELFKMKEVSSEMKNKPECYVKVINKDYFDNMKLIRNYRLLFLTKLHYKKMRKIEKMIEKYHESKEKYYKTENEYILINYLKKICVYLKECEVIEIISDDIESFETRFFNIHKFVTESYIYKLHKNFFSCEGEKNAYKYFY